MPLTNCKTNPILTLSENCVLISRGINDQVPKFAITKKKKSCSRCNFIDSRACKTIRSI